jgi:hypothetical protein
VLISISFISFLGLGHVGGSAGLSGGFELGVTGGEDGFSPSFELVQRGEVADGAVQADRVVMADIIDHVIADIGLSPGVVRSWTSPFKMDTKLLTNV